MVNEDLVAFLGKCVNKQNYDNIANINRKSKGKQLLTEIAVIYNGELGWSPDRVNLQIDETTPPHMAAPIHNGIQRIETKIIQSVKYYSSITVIFYSLNYYDIGKIILSYWNFQNN